MIWILFVLFVLLAFAMLAVYKFEDSLFSKATTYSLFDVLSNNRVRTLYKLTESLKATKEKYDILFNVQLEPNEEPVDVVLMHATGIYLVQVIQKNGWIAGREQDIDWSQLLYKNRKELFSNPIHHVQRHIYTLRSVLPNIETGKYRAVVIFTDTCSFQKIELHSNKVDVLKSKDIKGWVATLHQQEEVLATEEIQEAYDLLQERKVAESMAMAPAK